MCLCPKPPKPRCLASRCSVLELRLARIIGKRNAPSRTQTFSKIEGALQELDETAYWLELLVEAKIVSEDKLAPLRKETDELIAIFVTIVSKMKRK